MSATSPTSIDLTRVAGWSVLAPLVGLWPFLSAMPAFTLLGGDVTALGATLNVLLLLTGFWVAAPLAIVAWYALPPAGKASLRERASRRPAPFALLVPVWTALYTAIAVLGH